MLVNVTQHKDSDNVKIFYLTTNYSFHKQEMHFLKRKVKGRGHSLTFYTSEKT